MRRAPGRSVVRAAQRQEANPPVITLGCRPSDLFHRIEPNGATNPMTEASTGLSPDSDAAVIEAYLPTTTSSTLSPSMRRLHLRLRQSTSDATVARTLLSLRDPDNKFSRLPAASAVSLCHELFRGRRFGAGTGRRRAAYCAFHRTAVAIGGLSSEVRGTWETVAVSVQLSEFAKGLRVETAFDVLAVAKGLKAKGKDVVELQIGDSPFPSTSHAKKAGIAAIEENQTHYCPSIGLPTFREAIAERMNREYGLELSAANVVVGPGAKVFEQFFCEAVLNPGDEVLLFSPQFPTYIPNIERRQCKVVTSALLEENEFRPTLSDVEAFVARPKARAIFLNSPHNPTGGVATESDVRALSDLIRGKNIALFSDEPYDHMVWRGKHHTPLAQPGMLDQCVSAYTFSKSYSMSGWRLGYAVSSPRLVDAIAKAINTALSCVPPLVQLAGAEALKQDTAERDEVMGRFRGKVELLCEALAKIDEIRVLPPAGTFYVFPNVTRVCNRLGITSHGLAMYLLESADDDFGVACLGGECFGAAGHGFLRFSCAEPDERLVQAIEFLPEAFGRTERIGAYLSDHPEFKLAERYPEPVA